jgi:hypothetical protein
MQNRKHRGSSSGANRNRSASSAGDSSVMVEIMARAIGASLGVIASKTGLAKVIPIRKPPERAVSATARPGRKTANKKSRP